MIFYFIGKYSLEKKLIEETKKETKIENYKKLVNKHKSKLSNNEKVLNIIYKFLDKYNPVVFNSSYHLIAFERFLYEINNEYKKILWIDELKQTDFFPPNTIGYSVITWFNKPLKNFEIDIKFWSSDREMLKEIDRFYKKEFNQLLEVIKSYDKFESNKIAVSTLWCLLREVAIDYYSDVFDVKFGEKYFNNISNLNVKECVALFLKYIFGQGKSASELVNMFERREELGIERFFRGTSNTFMFSCYLVKKNKIKSNNLLATDLLTVESTLHEMIYSSKWIHEMQKNKILEFENSLLNKDSNVTIHEIDLMNGIEFEYFINDLFIRMGYESEVTKTSGDQGIDIIAKKNGKSFGIQAKCYSNVVSNKAVQEVVAGLAYYKIDQGIVITNNKFTKSAEELARANNILLWDREILKDKINVFM